MIIRVNESRIGLLLLTMTQVNNSPIKDYVHQNNHTQPTYEMTPVFKPFAVLLFYTIILLVLILLCDISVYTHMS